MKRNPFKKEQPKKSNTELPDNLQPKSGNKKLCYKNFRHNEADKLCDWVTDNKIELQTIAGDGNKLIAFYWETRNIEL